jgi:hypothetical protein
LNYVHPALSEPFTVGDTDAMTVNVENGIPTVAIDRPFFYSVGNFDDSLIDGYRTFANGYTMELGGHSPGSVNIIHAGETTPGGDWTAIASRPINGIWEGAVDIASTDREQTISADVSVNLNHCQAQFFSLRVSLNP